jgi:hypothetical protein
MALRNTEDGKEEEEEEREKVCTCVCVQESGVCVGECSEYAYASHYDAMRRQADSS